ncbi:RNA polymerase sigma-70 factor [Reichenbachiella agarivorans]|uniref:RNA polymerase sigma-70 factor n=1 Tax=Reichenbachiella agarivorans TaxID=2979464 RepID=A0ABY6CPL4_9BACT|nr:RNA polymerase sigma-70 factor [Reichenbachiella agarivorans]UXP31403.1 RNA polymerase sigma-70 factor [Reichenbachiella agarivorans]
MIDLRDEKSFEVLFKTYYQPLISFAYQYVKDHDMAEEVTQEVFTTLWQKAGSIEIRSSIKSYLYGAVRNASLNHLKHLKVVSAHQAYSQYNQEVGRGDFLELDELQQKINESLEKLPPKCREIFELSRFEEMKYKDIATELDISIKTVETQMSRALKVMRDTLGQYLPAYILWILLYN